MNKYSAVTLLVHFQFMALNVRGCMSIVGRGSSVVGPLALNVRGCVSIVGRGSSVVGALALNVRGCVYIVGRGSSVVGAPLPNVGKFIYPTVHESFGRGTKSRWSFLSSVCVRASVRSHTG